MFQQKMSNQSSVEVKKAFDMIIQEKYTQQIREQQYVNLQNIYIFKTEGDMIGVMGHFLHKEKQKWTTAGKRD